MVWVEYYTITMRMVPLVELIREMVVVVLDLGLGLLGQVVQE
jgi:hypothetical protein